MSNNHNDLKDPHQWLNYVPHTLHHSALYSCLYSHLNKDPEVLDLLKLVRTDQPIPVLFFSVINFLLLRERDHPLAQFYPYLCMGVPQPPSGAYPFFRDFCLTHREELQNLLPSARLQTNEVTRCANLLPAFELISIRGGRKPLVLIELGASAGLNLLWDHYHYQYGGISLGKVASAVQIRCALEGERFPPLPDTFPAVAQRVGIELFPLDLQNENDVRWLRSCIWPEERGRYRLLDAAIAIARESPPPLLKGDASELLPKILEVAPTEATLCIWHSFALHQGPAEVRGSIERQLIDCSRGRPLYRISLEVEPSRGGRPRLELFSYQHGALIRQEWLANCSIHGECMEWLLPVSLWRLPL